MTHPAAMAALHYECRICWTVYAPETGDVVRQIPPGTAFEDLPDDWSCPNCDAAKGQFIRVETEERRDG
ncbi:rubredoxin [Thiomonas sp. FB-Cd]|uniref:rubredoxin n=1 Tax=Thiomonas sp. FB-Cd TaxID=1158292 RepID=UPI0004DEFC4C|nr:rubredoxin [Thiomonas sp. FB-Cd]